MNNGIYFGATKYFLIWLHSFPRHNTNYHNQHTKYTDKSNLFKDHHHSSFHKQHISPQQEG